MSRWHNVYCLVGLVIVFPNSKVHALSVQDLLMNNAGVITGRVVEADGICNLNVYKPGEFGGDKAYWIEYEYDFSPAVYLAPYPNNGFIFAWEIDLSHGKIVFYVNEEKTEYTKLYFDLSDKKFKKIERIERGNYKMTCLL